MRESARGAQPREPSRLLPHLPRWLLGSTRAPHTTGSPVPLFWGRPTETRTPGSDVPRQRALPSRHPPRCGSPWRWGGRSRRGGPVRPDSMVGASRGGFSGDPERRRGSRGRTCAGLPSGRGPHAGARVSLALCCSERPRLCWDRRRCVSKGESLEVEGGTSPRKWLVNDRNDP